MHSGKIQNLDFEKYSFSDVDLKVTLVKTSAALSSSGPGTCEKQGEGEHWRTGFLPGGPSELTAPTGAHAEPVAFGLPFSPELCQCYDLFCDGAVKPSIFWNTQLEYQVTGRVTGAGKPLECGFTLC